jgi:hypothetical protein
VHGLRDPTERATTIRSTGQVAGESLHRHETLKPGSPRQFGWVMAAFFVLLAIIALWHAAWVRAGGCAAVSLAFAGAALIAPEALQPLNRLWFRLGLLLHTVVNPLILGAMFFVVMTPIGALMRAMGKRPIPMTFDKKASTYWMTRTTPPGPMTKQY